VVNLVTVPGIELMKTGKWSLSTGDWECTREVIAAALDAHDRGILRKPVIRLGHNDSRFSGDPAVGWLDNLRMSDDGDTLVGDMVGVPEWLAEILPSAYPSRSIEGLYDYTAPDGSEHDFVLTGLALLGATAPGVETLQSLQDVARLYDIAAAGQVGGKAIEFTIHAASAAPTKEEADVASFMEKLAEKLGLTADADAAAIFAAMEAAEAQAAPGGAAADPPADPATTETPTDPPVEVAASSAVVNGVLQIDATQYAALVAAAEAGQRAEARQLADDDNNVVMAAIRDGRIAPARKDHWLQSMKADREGTQQVLASLAKGLVPVVEAGHAGVAGQIGFEGAPDPDQQAKDYAHNKIMARLGLPTTKGSVN
jgi:hypothetical protein